MIQKLENVFSLASSVRAIELNKVFNGEPLFSVNDTGVNNRTIDSWDLKGLVITPRKNKGKHRRFNFLEFIWIKVLEELDAIGFKSKHLKRTKRELFYHVNFDIMIRLMQIDEKLVDSWPDGADKEELLTIVRNGLKRKRVSKQFNLFQLLLSEAILSKHPVSIVFFKGGAWLPIFDNNLDVFTKSLREKVMYESHTSISLSKIIREFIAHPKASLILNEINLFSDEEVKLLQMIRDGEYEGLTVNFQDTACKPLVLEKSTLSNIRLVELLQAGLYKSITVNISDSIKVSFNNPGTN